MSYLRIWRYRAAPGRETEFKQAYGSAGDWARLFGRADGYLGTELLQTVGPDPAFVTIDRWRSAADWERFLAAQADAYRALDQRLAPLCSEDVELGSFES